MIDQEQLISYHTVTLGVMTREGDTLAEITEQDGKGTQQSAPSMFLPVYQGNASLLQSRPRHSHAREDAVAVGRSAHRVYGLPVFMSFHRYAYRHRVQYSAPAAAANSSTCSMKHS